MPCKKWATKLPSACTKTAHGLPTGATPNASPSIRKRANAWAPATTAATANPSAIDLAEPACLTCTFSYNIASLYVYVQSVAPPTPIIIRAPCDDPVEKVGAGLGTPPTTEPRLRVVRAPRGGRSFWGLGESPIVCSVRETPP